MNWGTDGSHGKEGKDFEMRVLASFIFNALDYCMMSYIPPVLRDLYAWVGHWLMFSVPMRLFLFFCVVLE